MPISHKYKLIFIHIPKNAGTALTKYLQMKDEGHHSWQYYRRRYPAQWKTYTKIAIIRNPWDRVISNYTYARMEKSYWHSETSKSGKHVDYDLLLHKSFEELLDILATTAQVLRHQGWSCQKSYIVDSKNNLMVDHIMDISQVNENLSAILQRPMELPMVNTSPPLKEDVNWVHFDNVVNSVYKADILYFKFTSPYLKG